eukprot:6206039-Pleurochrysis_carterae.AAC.1
MHMRTPAHERTHPHMNTHMQIGTYTRTYARTSTRAAACVPRRCCLSSPLRMHGRHGYSCVSVGGGAIGDVAGMLASTIYHGIALVHLTTTTMGALDAAIDTRNGINHAYGRDLIGTHWPATAVVIDPTTFSSLSQRHVLNGLAMALKRGFCQSREHLEMITRPVIDKGAALLRDQTYLEMVCKASIEIKLPTLSHYVQTDYND